MGLQILLQSCLCRSLPDMCIFYSGLLEILFDKPLGPGVAKPKGQRLLYTTAT